MTNPQIAEIAAKLTAAQRELLLDDHACQLWNHAALTGVRNHLARKGLVQRTGPFLRWSLTPLGQSVAAYLKERSA
ncbi:hypothetical protein [Novosphingobium sp.]|uniref:hypothetical protein n=1 Tax=Novosphingobium sp. TaxID=1874826 RepID=UPI002619E980|nr:hypothetical protein [Novosphingobium sp.]